MSRKILDRYERDAGGRLIVHVAVKRVEDLYERFDKTAQYQKKDFDDDFVDYLVACVREIGRAEFVIRFSFEQLPGDVLEQKVRDSLRTYFQYRSEAEFLLFRRQAGRFALLFVVGMLILVFTLWAREPMLPVGDAPLFRRFVFEGLTIAAWVAIWEGAAHFLFYGPADYLRSRLYGRISRAAVSISGQQAGAGGYG